MTEPSCDRVVPEQVEALWRIREQLGPALTPEERQLLDALREALDRPQKSAPHH